MGIDFRGISRRFRWRLELFRMRAAVALLKLLKPIVVKLGSQNQREQFAAEWTAHDQEIYEKWESVHRQALFTNVGLALSQSAGMEELLIGIICLLLRTSEINKVGTIMYSIISFPVRLRIIDELFLQEPLFSTLKPKWNKINNRLRGMMKTRDRLAHHTIYYGNKATTIAGGITLRPSRFDLRQETLKKYTPLDHKQISDFIDSVNKIIDDLNALLNSMTDLLNNETSQKKSPEPTPDQRQP